MPRRLSSRLGAVSDEPQGEELGFYPECPAPSGSVSRARPLPFLRNPGLASRCPLVTTAQPSEPLPELLPGAWIWPAFGSLYQKLSLWTSPRVPTGCPRSFVHDERVCGAPVGPGPQRLLAPRTCGEFCVCLRAPGPCLQGGTRGR